MSKENRATCKCPVCNSNACYIETAEETCIESRVCESCGFMTTSLYTVDSKYVDAYEKTTAEIIRKLRFTDTDLGQYWYPSTLFINGRGAIFPMGTEKEWAYAYAQVVPIPIHERLQYPIPEKTDEYYEQRLAVEKAVMCRSFKSAVEKLFS